MHKSDITYESGQNMTTLNKYGITTENGTSYPFPECPKVYLSTGVYALWMITVESTDLSEKREEFWFAPLIDGLPDMSGACDLDGIDDWSSTSWYTPDDDWYGPSPYEMSEIENEIRTFHTFAAKWHA